MGMQIIIALSGHGDRFRRAGYTEIKPLIRVDGRPMIEHVADLFPGETDILFICSQRHLDETPLRSELQRIRPSATIVGIEPHKSGPVRTAIEARDYIRDDAPVILNYCDFYAVWDYEKFKRTMKDLNCDGCITAYRGFHPHSLGPNLYAYMRADEKRLIEIREKFCFTDDRMNEYASAGTYYFKSGTLLKDTFDSAIRENLSTNGEFYVSTPYNMLVRDGKNVHIYELDKFIQWGTPEDLEEYQAWSNLFRKYRNWRPALFGSPGTNLIPIAGTGERFRQRGYTEPKPFIDVAGEPMLVKSMKTLPQAPKWIFVTLKSAVDETRVKRTLSDSVVGTVHVIPLDQPTAGQADTCLRARDFIDPELPLFIAPSDAAVVYDEDRWKRLTESGTDCVVWTFRNHPHANRNPQQYGWVRTTDESAVCGVSCKSPISDNVKSDPGVIGMFWFRKARIFEKAAKRMMESGARVGAEFYVDVAINNVLEAGHRVSYFDVDHFICLGTPDDVQTYKYWSEYFA